MVTYHVASANADGGNLHQNLVGVELREGQSFHGHVAPALEDLARMVAGSSVPVAGDWVVAVAEDEQEVGAVDLCRSSISSGTSAIKDRNIHDVGPLLHRYAPERCILSSWSLTMTGSGHSNQIGAGIGAHALPVVGPAGVVAVRQFVAAVVLLPVARPALLHAPARQRHRPGKRGFRNAWGGGYLSAAPLESEHAAEHRRRHHQSCTADFHHLRHYLTRRLRGASTKD